MAARHLCLVQVVVICRCVDFLFFFQRLTFDCHQILTCLTMTRIYKSGSEIWGASPETNLELRKHQNLRSISDKFATWSRISPERNKKTVLQTATSRAHADLIWWNFDSHNVMCGHYTRLRYAIYTVSHNKCASFIFRITLATRKFS